VRSTVFDHRVYVLSYGLFAMEAVLLVLMRLMTFGRPSWWSR
jgi:hypothetical protein